MRFSPSTLGWYPEHVEYLALPDDVIDVDDNLYILLFGKAIEAGPDDMPREAVVAPPSFDQRKAALLKAVDAHLNAAAKAKGYDSILSASLRAALPTSPFHGEGVAFGTWMDLVYAKCYEVLAQVQANEIAEPDEAQLISMLPALQLPG
jgi:hypothetical protein